VYLAEEAQRRRAVAQDVEPDRRERAAVDDGLGRPQADAIAPHYPIERPLFLEVAPPDRVVALDQDIEALRDPLGRQRATVFVSPPMLQGRLRAFLLSDE
jgi:hypothetical protein